MIREESCILDIKTEKVVSKQMEVFYNPVMKLNRDVSVLLLKALGRKGLQIASPLEGSGVRAIRFLKELPASMVKVVCANDISPGAVKAMKKNLALNKLSKSKKIIVSGNDATLFLLSSSGFDYIDVDPFGSPNPFLDSAVKRLARNGILAVTATDTAALSGTSIKACRRKYWAEPVRNEMMHELGLRILIRKVQLIGAQYEKALIPIFSYSKDHYMRVFLRCDKGRQKADDVLKSHGPFSGAGPLWMGQLWDAALARKMATMNTIKEDQIFLETIAGESTIPVLGFYDLPKVAQRHGLRSLPRQELILAAVKKEGFRISATHFAPNSIRSDIPEKELVQIIKPLL